MICLSPEKAKSALFHAIKSNNSKVVAMALKSWGVSPKVTHGRQLSMLN